MRPQHTLTLDITKPATEAEGDLATRFMVEAMFGGPEYDEMAETLEVKALFERGILRFDQP